MRRVYYLKMFVLFAGLIATLSLAAQDEEKPKRSKPVRKPFNANQLVDLQTVVQPNAQSLELIIHHRFGNFKNGLSDLYGIYAPSNIRIGLNYGITDKLMVGVGTEKDNKLQDIQWKYNIFEQTKENEFPVSLSYYGNMAIDARDEAVFGEGEVNISNRMTYFHQLIFTRMFTKELSVVLGTGVAHINKVDSIKQNDVFALSLGGKYSITKKMTFVTEYDHPFYIQQQEDYEVLPEPNLGFALEIGTSTHIFQITCSQYRHIIPQRNFLYNTNAMDDGGWVIGFNINVKF